MKVLFVAALVGFAALAHAEDEFPSYYAPVKTQATACKNGKIEVFIEQKDESSTPVARVCKNGSFARATKADVAHLGCKEGRTEIFIEVVGDAQTPVRKVCHNGAFVNL